jgi:uncharacterized protein YecT (DUF1311 family)
MATKTMISMLGALTVLAMPPLARADRASCEEVSAVYAAAIEALDEEQQLLLDIGQRAWLDYRNATCRLFSAREDNPGLSATAFADCIAFINGERVAELRLVGRSAAAGEPAALY